MRDTFRFKKLFLLTSVAAVPLMMFADVPKKENADTEAVSLSMQQEIPKISEAFGHLIGKNLDSLGLNFEMKLVIKGIEDSFLGKESPMTETDCIQAITMIQEQAFQKQSLDNLKEAEAFLVKNSKQDGVVALEEGKLQYKRLQEGSGVMVEEHFTPMIRYIGRFIDGKVFGESQEDEMISLDETIPGFQKAIIGMKEGEKREVFIHPDLAYGVNGYMPPNSLLKFEIEVVKANIAKAEESPLSINAKDQKTEEIAVDLKTR
jgi:peptidylprolyl isomerase